MRPEDRYSQEKNAYRERGFVFLLVILLIGFAAFVVIDMETSGGPASQTPAQAFPGIQQNQPGAPGGIGGGPAAEPQR